jgi:hypothetical protein
MTWTRECSVFSLCSGETGMMVLGMMVLGMRADTNRKVNLNTLGPESFQQQFSLTLSSTNLGNVRRGF